MKVSDQSLPLTSDSLTKQTSGSRLRSDAGTILLHWLTVLSMAVSLATGLRISADGQFSEWARKLSAILPTGEVWTLHILAGLLLCGIMLTYWIYLQRAALIDRNAPSRMATLRPPTNRRLRWRAFNVALHWFAYTAIGALTITGIALYLGYASWFLTIHNALAWAMLAYFVIHTLAHLMLGGIEQVLRLFRPVPLQGNARTQVWPLGIALLCGAIGLTGIVTIDWNTRASLTAAVVTRSPNLDGKLDEAVWNEAQTITVETHQGANLGGSGTSTVDIKAIVDKAHIHFAFRWQDPTRSLMRAPLIKTKDGWRVMATNVAEADINDYYEDKFAVLFSHNDGLGGGESTFLGSKPLTNYPKSPHDRGLHYTQDGRIMDLWQWKSSRGGLLGHVDDMHFGPPKTPNAQQIAGTKRYPGGYDADPGKAMYEYNYLADGPAGYNSPVRLKRLPLDLVQMRLELGSVPTHANGNNDAGSIWWLTPENSVPYSTALDAATSVGTMIPSTLNIHKYSGDRADLSGGARWHDGFWTLEVSRKRNTGSPYDISFNSGQRIFVWVSVFDHNQTRHTRHQRSIVLNIP